VFNESPKRGIYPLLEVDYDLLILAKNFLATLPIKVKGTWVKGHYKGDNRLIQHDLNAIVDTMAEQFRLNPPMGFAPMTKPLFHPLQVAALYVQGSMITSRLKQTIYERRFLEGLAHKIRKRYMLTESSFDRIDWDIFGKVFTSSSRFHKISLAKFVHGLWNTGEQKVRFHQDEHGLCPCCKAVQETTYHVFQCPESSVVNQRSQQLNLFYNYLDEQELSKPIKECIFAGMQGWLHSTEAHPVLLAPTRGKVMPTEQLATAAFVDQTAIGWDAFFRGHISKAWRKAILQTSSIRDADATETHLRRLIKHLHAFSLSVWEYRNGVLHGTTYSTKREQRRKLVREKVNSAYDLYFQGSLLVLSRDTYLFTKKTVEERLVGDEDTLLCWLRLVEVAMKVYEVQHVKAQKQAATFFQQFRALGRQKLATSRHHTLTLSQHAQEFLAPPQQIDLKHIQREDQQVSSEASAFTQARYKLRKQRPSGVEGLEGTILSTINVGQTDTQHSFDSILSPGPFHILPIVEQEISSDSSYQPSHQRDVAFDYAETTSSTISSGTPVGYRSFRRQSHLERADALLLRIEGLLQPQEEEDSSALPQSTLSSSISDDDPQATESIFPSTSSSYMPTTTSPLWSLSAQRLLRFPLHRIAAATPVDAQLNTIDWESQYENLTVSINREPTEDAVTSSSSGPLIFAAQHLPPRQIYIEEFTPPGVQNRLPEREIQWATPFQLAQDDSTVSGSIMTTLAHQPGENFQDWLASAGGFSPPSVGSSTASDGHSSVSASSMDTTHPVLEILSTPANSSSSSQTASSSSASYRMRGLSLSPPPEPEGHSTSDSSMVSSIEPSYEEQTISDSSIVEDLIMLGDSDTEMELPVDDVGWRSGPPPPATNEREDDPSILGGAPQGARKGLSVAPIAFLRLIIPPPASDDISLPASLPSLSSGTTRSGNPSILSHPSHVDEDAEFHSRIGDDEGPLDFFQVDTQSTTEVQSDGSFTSSSRLSPGYEGDTTASTTSYLSEVLLFGRIDYGIPQVEGFELEIPERELDDPPD